MTQKISANVPQGARKQIREANRIMAELNTRPGAPPDLGAPAAPSAPDPRLPMIDLTPVPTATTPDRPQRAPAPPPSVAAQPPAAPAAPAAPTPEQLLEQERHKNSVLAGKYNAETARLLGAAQALQDENNRLMRRLSEQPAAPAAAPRAEDQFDLSAVSAKEREEYGEELVQLMARIAKANSSKEVNRLQQELAQMRGQVHQSVQAAVASSQDRVYQALDSWDSQWRVINVSQEFLDWLDQHDIISGIARKTGLMNAFETGNAQRVVAIFKAYVQEDSHSRSSQQPVPAQPQVNRQDLIAPGQPRGGSGEAPNGQGGRLWSEQEIDDFYSRVQRKRISEEERKATEADIQKALVEGRIVPRHNHQGVSNSV